MNDHWDEIKKFKRDILLINAVSLGISTFGIVGLLLFFNVKILSVVYEQHPYYKSPFWLCFSILFIIMGLWFCAVATRHKHRLLWLLKNAKPIKMRLILEIIENMESTEYFAYLTPLSKKNQNPGEWRVSLGYFNKKFTYGENADVFFDPDGHFPSIIKTNHGLLWKLAGNGSAQKL